jgi:pimeloyl-ACP methyl ester carboxylesterase
MSVPLLFRVLPTVTLGKENDGIPISGVWDPGDACRLRGIPVRAYHGARDAVVPLADETEMIASVRACGGDATLTVYADTGHDAWTRRYADPALYAWLLAQRRRPAPAP